MAQAHQGAQVRIAVGTQDAVTIEDAVGAQPQARALSNTASKSIRDEREDPPGFPRVGRVDLFDEHPFLVKTLVRSAGVDYELAEPRQSWRSMLKGMQRPTMERIVGDDIVASVPKPLQVPTITSGATLRCCCRSHSTTTRPCQSGITW